MIESASYAAGPSDSTYTVTFPSAARVAELHISTPSESAPKPLHSAVTARGKVSLPKVCQIQINLSYDGLENIQSLDQVSPDQIVRFSAAKLDFDDSHMTHLKKFKNLITLNLDDTVITDKSLPTIGTFTKLLALRFNGTDITGSGFASIANLPQLMDLNCAGINLKPGALAALKPLGTHLSNLNVSRVGLTRAEMPAIADLKSLVNLRLDGNKALDNSCVKMLLPLKNLQLVDISDTAITDKCLGDLYKLPTLKIVMIRSHQFWTGGKPQKTRPGINFEDGETHTRIPLEMFTPLH
jgi:hypothetical protein